MAATSSGLVVNSPASKWLTKNDAETIFRVTGGQWQNLEGLRHGTDASVVHWGDPLSPTRRTSLPDTF